MSDLFQGQSMSAKYDFISAGTAHTFSFDFQPDKVVFNNLTKWIATAGGHPVSVYFKDQTTAAYAYQQTVIDSVAGASFNFKTATTNGFTVVNTAGGQSLLHSTISAISAADPCVITHSAFTFQDNQIIRITDLGNVGVTDRGMGQLNDLRFKVVVVNSTNISLKDVITGEPIDSSAYTAYVSGGRITLETQVISLNNPQVSPYSNLNPYNPNPYNYAPIVFQLIAGTDVMQDVGDEFAMEVFKYGQVISLGTFSV